MWLKRLYWIKRIRLVLETSLSWYNEHHSNTCFIHKRSYKRTPAIASLSNLPYVPKEVVCSFSSPPRLFEHPSVRPSICCQCDYLFGLFKREKALHFAMSFFIDYLWPHLKAGAGGSQTVQISPSCLLEHYESAYTFSSRYCVLCLQKLHRSLSEHVVYLHRSHTHDPESDLMKSYEGHDTGI